MRPADFSYASAGNGTPQHLAGELYARAVNVKPTHTPYRGAGPALDDLVGRMTAPRATHDDPEPAAEPDVD